MSSGQLIRIEMAPRPITQQGKHVTQPTKVPETKKRRDKRQKRPAQAWR